MNYNNKIVFLIFFISTLLYSQTEVNSGISLPDSLTIQTNPLLELNYKFEEFEFLVELNSVEQLILNENDGAALLKTRMLLGSILEQDNFKHPHFASPLYRQFLEDQEFNAISYVLGMVQLGAVGYLAYKHIKKYGFLY